MFLGPGIQRGQSMILGPEKSPEPLLGVQRGLPWPVGTLRTLPALRIFGIGSPAQGSIVGRLAHGSAL